MVPPEAEAVGALCSTGRKTTACQVFHEDVAYTGCRRMTLDTKFSFFKKKNLYSLYFNESLLISWPLLLSLAEKVRSPSY